MYNVSNTTEFLQAQNTELHKWSHDNVYDKVDDDGQDTISTRWVFTGKQNELGEKSIKARLVARDYEEDSSEIRCDSPTITKENLRLVTSIAASHSWVIHSICRFPTRYVHRKNSLSITTSRG